MTDINCNHLVDWDDFEVPIIGEGATDQVSYYESYKEFKALIKNMPTGELIKRGWIESKDDMGSLYPLFRNIHLQKLTGLFRKKKSADISLYAIWQTRIASAAKLLVAVGQVGSFEGLSKSDLKKIARLSQDESIVTKLSKILSEMGIVLVYEKALPGMKLDGVVFKIDSGHPVIGISFRYKRLDSFWFTLLHELSHISLHYGALDDPIFDDLNSPDTDVMEKQADRLAKNSFVEKHKWRNCKPKYTNKDSDIVVFAQENGVHPAIIAGMLQKETNSFELYRKIIDAVDIREVVFGNK